MQKDTLIDRVLEGCDRFLAAVAQIGDDIAAIRQVSDSWADRNTERLKELPHEG